jgi:hypothetical protein
MGKLFGGAGYTVVACDLSPRQHDFFSKAGKIGSPCRSLLRPRRGLEQRIVSWIPANHIFTGISRFGLA